MIKTFTEIFSVELFWTLNPDATADPTHGPFIPKEEHQVSSQFDKAAKLQCQAQKILFFPLNSPPQKNKCRYLYLRFPSNYVLKSRRAEGLKYLILTKVSGALNNNLEDASVPAL